MAILHLIDQLADVHLLFLPVFLHDLFQHLLRRRWHGKTAKRKQNRQAILALASSLLSSIGWHSFGLLWRFLQKWWPLLYEHGENDGVFQKFHIFFLSSGSVALACWYGKLGLHWTHILELSFTGKVCSAACKRSRSVRLAVCCLTTRSASDKRHLWGNNWHQGEVWIYLQLHRHTELGFEVSRNSALKIWKGICQQSKPRTFRLKNALVVFFVSKWIRW